MKPVERTAEHIDYEKGYSFKVKAKANFGVIFEVEVISMTPGLFDDLCSNFATFTRGKMIKDVYFMGPQAFSEEFGSFSSDVQKKACEILFDLLRQTLSGVFE